MNRIVKSLEINPVIAALPHIEVLENAALSTVEVVFVLSDNIITIEEHVSRLKYWGKKVFVHVDLIDGLGKDLMSIDYVHQRVKPHGIVSTRSNLLKYGKELGLVTVQRLFLVDSLSFESGIKMVKSYQPDFVEVLPGIIPRVIRNLGTKIHQPIIAGGMILTKMDIINALNAGAIAVSTSKESLWE
jgi:glycerol uptake operon antiterminator